MNKEIESLKREVAAVGTETRLDRALRERNLPPVIEDRIKTQAESRARKQREALTSDEIEKLIEHEVAYAETQANRESEEHRTPEERAEVIDQL